MNTVKLSDEELDPLESADIGESNLHISLTEGYLPWDTEDLEDIRRIIKRLDPKDQFIIEAYLDGMNFYDVSVSEKYWRYHFAKSIIQIKKEMDCE
jgi:hypothetical protein